MHAVRRHMGRAEQLIASGYDISPNMLFISLQCFYLIDQSILVKNKNTNQTPDVASLFCGLSISPTDSCLHTQ